MAITAKKKQKVSYEGIPSKLVKDTEELSCELTDLEWNNRARELAEAHRKTEAEKERKKSLMAELNADVKIAEGKETKLANIVATRSEQREVTVETKYDYELGLVTRRRTDTEEIISSREMTDRERQAELELVDANNFIEGRHEGEDSDESATAVPAQE